MTVQIELGQTVITCGGAKSFTSTHGEAANCGKFVACLHTIVDTTNNKFITVSFSGPADESLCEIPVAAILLPRVLPALTANCTESDLVCRVDDTCIPQSKICDGVADCSDASDETYCSNWRLVSRARRPICANVANITNREVLSFDECKSIAIAVTLNRVSTDMSVVFRKNWFCEVYACVTGVNVLSTTNEVNRTGYFYSRIEDTEDFKVCTSELSCSGRGRVTSSSPPCVCMCESGYTGTDCASAVDMTALSSLAIETSHELSAAQRQGMRSSVEGSLRHHGLSSGSVRVSKMSTVGTTTTTRTFAAQTATTSHYYVAEIEGSSLGSRVESIAIAGALSAASIASLNSSLLASSIYARDIGSKTLLIRTGRVFCDIIVLPDASRMFCDNIIFDYSQYYNAVMLDYTATFYGSLSGWSAGMIISTARNGDPPCVSNDVPVLNLGCSTIRKCTAAYPKSMRFMSMRPHISYESSPVGSVELCSTVSASNLSVEVQFSYVNQLSESTIKVGAIVGDVDIQTDLSKVVFVVLCALSGFSVVLLVYVVLLLYQKRVYLAALFMTMLSVTVIVTIVLLLQYFNGRYPESHYDIFVFEYRSPKCGRSSFNPIPHRISRVPANDRCARAEAFGTSEGVVFMRGSCGAKVYTGNVSFNAAFTLSGCNSGLKKTLKAGQCYAESDVMNKPTDLSEYVELRCYIRDESTLLVNTVTSQFRPNTQPVESADPTALASRETLINAVSGREQFFHGHRRHEQPVIVVPTGNTHVFGGIKRDNSTLVGTVPVEIKTPEGKVEIPADLGPGSTLGNMSLDFNAATSATEERFATDALRYLGVQGSPIDVNPGKPFTITLWTKMTNTSTGFIFALTDNWEVTQTNENPILQKVTEVLQNGLSKNNYFSKVWNLYLGLYANARAKTLTLVYASPTSDGHGAIELNWDMAAPKVQGERIFDGNWHFLAVVFDKENGGDYARLFIDGQTSFVDEGWKVCLDKSLRGIKALPAEVPVFSATEEEARHGAVLYIGHINAPIYNVQVHNERLLQEKIIFLGAPYMKRYAVVDATNSLLLGYILGFLALGCLIAAIALFTAAKLRTRCQDETQSEITRETDGADVGSKAAGGIGSTGGKLVGRLKSGKSGGSAANSSVLRSISRMGNGVLRRATHLRMLVLPFITVAQTMTIYFQGWQWPEMFRVNANLAVFWLSFDLNISFPEVSAMFTPALQVFLAFGVFYFILAVLYQDNGLFIERIKNKDGLPNPTIHPDLPIKFSISFGKKKLNIYDPVYIAAFAKSVRKAIGGHPAKPSQVDVVFEEFPDVPVSCVLTSVAATGKACVHVEINDPDLLKLDSIEAGVSGVMECVVPDAFQCPEHKEILIKSIPHIHNMVMDDEGLSPYVCAYQCREGTLCKKLRGDKVAVCPGRSEEFLVCSNDNCSYCVCTKCFGGGRVATARSVIGSKLYTLRRFGAFPIIGFILLLLAQTLHMPIMQNAFMIVYCHINYQCLFPTCYNNPTFTFLTFVVIAVITIAVFGIGLVVYLYHVALQRKRLINEYMTVDGSSCLATMNPADWDELLMADNSLLKNLYEPYTYRWMWVHPTTLVFKLGAVMPIVFAAPNSLTQLALAAFVEVVQLIFWIATNPFQDYWVGFLTQAGSIHQVAQLALMSFHRVAVSEDPDDNRFAVAMIYVSIAYIVIVVFVIIFAIVIPKIQSSRASAKRGSGDAESELHVFQSDEDHQEEQQIEAQRFVPSPGSRGGSGTDENEVTNNPMAVRSPNSGSVHEPDSDQHSMHPTGSSLFRTDEHAAHQEEQQTEADDNASTSSAQRFVPSPDSRGGSGTAENEVTNNPMAVRSPNEPISLMHPDDQL